MSFKTCLFFLLCMPSIATSDGICRENDNVRKVRYSKLQNYVIRGDQEALKKYISSHDLTLTPKKQSTLLTVALTKNNATQELSQRMHCLQILCDAGVKDLTGAALRLVLEKGRWDKAYYDALAILKAAHSDSNRADCMGQKALHILLNPCMQNPPSKTVLRILLDDFNAQPDTTACELAQKLYTKHHDREYQDILNVYLHKGIV